MIAENAILGSILKAPYLIKETDIQPEHLTDGRNKALLTTIRELNTADKPIDLISILSAVNPDSIGGAAHLQQIERTGNVDKFDEHMEIVMDKWREREKNNLLHMAAQENWGIEQITGELGKLSNDKTTDHHSITNLLHPIYESAWEVLEQQKGSPTGLSPVDVITGGWQDSDLIIIAARPSVGKTDVMLHFAKEAGWHDRLPIVFSLEMPATRLRDRLMASVGRYDRGKFKNLGKFLTDAEKDRWVQTIGRVDMTRIQIYDKPRQTLAEMRTKIRKSAHEHPGKKPVVFIDYLTLIKPAEYMNGNVHQQVGEISKGLKAIAKEFECPVICLAQLSRAVEQRQDKRPMLSDLRESGSIEEDADVVMFLYRDSYYSQNNDDKELELIFAKNRNGETGKTVVHYEKSTGELGL
ncbi:AAA family ATPase [Sporosarcina sp. Sa2YVA2]|uniref:DNA 5'-3' helicase n=1 Tax=Sporosarcina quadrami TaxID=2762234 RepID=A0ABR8U8U6_9BACL|nr:DnaB-like helicase C-terminal domain-containing protein [Sporosarcina quadrami]MBD7984440.1 AAA family ATPase [Sporosarcina quadrami]